jgi:O-antigen/teichoic acid export membrane protein
LGIYGDDKKRILILFVKSLKIILILSGILSLILFCYAKDILNLWLGVDFVKNSVYIFRIFSIIISIYFLALIPFTLLQSIGRPDLPAKFHLIEFTIYLIILYIFIKYFGIIGAAIAWGLRMLLDFILLYWKTLKLLPELYAIIDNNHIWHILFLILLLSIFLIFINIILAGLFTRALLLIISLVLFFITIWRYDIDLAEKKLLFSIFRLKA